MIPRRVWIVWGLFLVRATFYCAMLPLWEGWDEYAHFAWLDHWITHSTLPDFNDPMDAEVEASLKVTPLPWELRWIPSPALTHDQWWKLAESERAARVSNLNALTPGIDSRASSRTGNFYEAQQPPLYYWVLSLPLRLLNSSTLPHRVLLIRLLSALLASFAIPLTWATAQKLTDDRAAFFAAALLAVAPGFAIDASRVANDSAAIALFALSLFLLTRKQTTWWQLGLTVGAALLAKAYMLVLIPIVLIRWVTQKRELTKALALAAAIAGWWYARNLLLGRSFSGWLEHGTPSQLIAGLLQINWLTSLAVIANSFTWFGAWSFLTLKSWIYTTLNLTALGCALTARKRSSLLYIAISVYALAMIYGSLIYFAVHKVPNLPGWYLWPAGGALAIILASGHRAIVLTLITLLALTDIYGAAGLMAPYCAGLVPRSHANIQAFFTALSILGIPVSLAAAWILATTAIPASAFISLNQRPKTPAASTAPR